MLYDEAERVMRRHSNCPWAEPEMHNDDGTVAVSVAFDTVVRLEDDDPRAKPDFDPIENTREDTEQDLQRREWDDMMDRFVETKREGE